MYTLIVNNHNYAFADNQQWIDNDTFCVIAICDGEEYCIDYDAPDIPAGEENRIDWESPSLISRLSDGFMVYVAH